MGLVSFRWGQLSGIFGQMVACLQPPEGVLISSGGQSAKVICPPPFFARTIRFEADNLQLFGKLFRDKIKPLMMQHYR